MNRPNPEEILVIQFADTGVFCFCISVEDHDLSKGRDFLAFHTSFEIEKKVFENKPQLLITGIVSSDVRDVAIMVENLRQRNPQLVVVTYSSCDIPGECFDLQIDKKDNDSSEQLVGAIRDFRSAKLRRKEVLAT